MPKDISNNRLPKTPNSRISFQPYHTHRSKVLPDYAPSPPPPKSLIWSPSGQLFKIKKLAKLIPPNDAPSPKPHGVPILNPWGVPTKPLGQIYDISDIPEGQLRGGPYSLDILYVELKTPSTPRGDSRATQLPVYDHRCFPFPPHRPNTPFGPITPLQDPFQLRSSNHRSIQSRDPSDRSTTPIAKGRDVISPFRTGNRYTTINGTRDQLDSVCSNSRVRIPPKFTKEEWKKKSYELFKSPDW